MLPVKTCKGMEVPEQGGKELKQDGHFRKIPCCKTL